MHYLLESEAVSQGLVFRNAPPLWVVILVIVPGIVLFAALFYRMGRERSSPRVRAVLAGLRVLALLLVAALLMDPAWRTQVVETRKALAVVLVDVSASMSHKDDYATSPDLASDLRTAAGLPPATPMDTHSRLDLVQRVLDRQDDPFLQELSKEHDLRIYSFGESLSGVSSVRDLRARDRVTALGQAIESILEEPDVKSRPVGGIVVITDGKNTSGPLPEAAAGVAERRRIPIHTVGVGDPKASRDIELVSVIAPSVVLAEDTMVVDLRVRQRGFPEQRVKLRLLEDGLPLPLDRPKGPVLLRDTENDQDFQLSYKPMQEGRYRWVVEVEPQPGEYNTDNNRKTIEVNVRRERLRVLYVEGLPRYEYRKLKDFLVRGQQAFRTQCYLTSAQKGFPQEATEGLQPLQSFPASRERLFEYDVIVFGDVDPRKLTEDPRMADEAMENMRSFVENGGGFVMLAGRRFSPWAYRDTPIGDIVPVVVDAGTSPGGSPSGEGFRLQLTELGRIDPVMQLVGDPERNERVWAGKDTELLVTELVWYARVKKAKPGTRVLAVHESESNEHGPYPLIVSGSYGDGPVLFVGFDEAWKWYLRQGPVLFYRFWGNIVHELARTKLFQGDKRFQLLSNRSEYSQGDRITLTAYVKDKSFRPVDKPRQEVVLRPPRDSGHETRKLMLSRVEPGVFEKTLLAQEEGEYQAWIPAGDGLSDEMISPISFRVVISDVERKEPILDAETLKDLAAATGGTYLLLPGARELLRRVGSGTVEIPRQRRFVSLRDGDQSWVWLLPLVFVGMLAAEWLLRKRFRML